MFSQKEQNFKVLNKMTPVKVYRGQN